MPLGSVAAQNASLDNDYGTTHGPNAPASHEFALLDATGVELDGASAPGYARVPVAAADWPPAVDGSKQITVTLPPPTGEWPAATAWVLYAVGTTVAWDTAELLDPLLVTGASSDGPQVVVSIFYSNTT